MRLKTQYTDGCIQTEVKRIAIFCMPDDTAGRSEKEQRKEFWFQTVLIFQNDFWEPNAEPDMDIGKKTPLFQGKEYPLLLPWRKKEKADW